MYLVFTTSQVNCYAKSWCADPKLQLQRNGTRINAALYNYSTEQ